MRVVLQRVSSAAVSVNSETVGSIGNGFLVLLGIHRDDTETEIEYIARKILGLRVFVDDNGKMNRSVLDIGGSLLIVSQFTLYADTHKGRRPSFEASAHPEKAIPIYESFIARLSRDIHIETGKFGAKMVVELTNDGPVTIILDSRENRSKK